MIYNFIYHLLQVYKQLEQRIESHQLNPVQGALNEDSLLMNVPTPLSI